MLREMFSPIGGPKEENQDIDWFDDLKFFIDNDNTMLNSFILPTVAKHKKYVGHPHSYKLYMKPLERCIESYCEQYDIADPGQTFPKEGIIKLAKKFASMQEDFIKRGDYER
jgi:hypothetical protein